MSRRFSVSRASTRAQTIRLGVLALVFTIVAAVGFISYAHAGRHDGPDDAARTAVAQAAADAVTAVMTFTPTSDPTRADVLARLTGRFGVEYRTQGPDTILPNAIDARASMSATVIGAGVNSYSADRARLLMFVDQQVSVPGLTTDGATGDRVTVSRWALMSRVADRWLLADLLPVSAAD